MPQIPTNNKEDGGIIMMKTGDRGPGTTHTLSCMLFLRAPAHSVLREVWIPVFMKEAKEFQRAQELSDRAGKSETEAKTHHEPQRALGVSTLGKKSQGQALILVNHQPLPQRHRGWHESVSQHTG